MPEMTSIDALSHPAMIIDTARPEIRQANASAWRLWGLRGAVDLPITLDAAMPALKHLAQETKHSGGKQTAALVFWTWAGAQNLKCAFQSADEADTVLVIFEDGASDTTAQTVPKPPTDEQPSQRSDDTINMQTMAHELRTPIGAIIALAEMIETEQFGSIGDPRYREYARDIRDSARLSLGIVASSLEHNANDTDLLKSFSELNLAELIQKCLRTVHQSASEANVTLRQVVPDDLPHLIASGPGLTQILLNLLTNAVKFTPEGGAVTVEANTTTQGGVILSVRDNGVGMTAIDTNVLIADSEHNDDTDREAKATEDRLPPRRGIGFSLVRRLAGAMSAEFEISSTRGVGTHASLTFPSTKVIPMAHAESDALKGS